MRRTLPLLLLAAACVPPLPDPVEPDASLLEVGETRTIELRHLALEIDRFEKTVDLEALRRLPPTVLDELWLLDVPLEGLMRNALDRLASLTLTQARQLPPSAQNLRTLLRMTPDDADLDGTALQEMTEISAALGIPKGRVLADLLQLGLSDPVIPRELATDVLLELFVGSHPATQTRPGPVDAEHPDGRWPVAPGSLPVTLADLVTGFATLAERCGPAETPFGLHPGFLDEVDGFEVVEDDFRMTVAVDVQALPFRGVDLGSVTDGAVNSVPRQAERMFRVQDPDWLVVEGVSERPLLRHMSVLIAEDEAFHAATHTREPEPLGPSTAWSLDPWDFERLLVEMAWRATSRIEPHCVAYRLGTGVQAFEACIDDTGWTGFTTFAGLGNPPRPTWLWETTLELAQVRLHDGGLDEGEADVSFALQDVELGLDADTIAATARDNLARDPRLLAELARVLTENGQGEPDVYYQRGPDDGPAEEQGDWLVFLAEADLPLAPDGGTARPYTYARAGFFADEDLVTRVGAPDPASPAHERVRIAPGDVLFVEDDAGARYRLDVGPKPSRARVALSVTRVR